MTPSHNKQNNELSPQAKRGISIALFTVAVAVGLYQLSTRFFFVQSSGDVHRRNLAHERNAVEADAAVISKAFLYYLIDHNGEFPPPSMDFPAYTRESMKSQQNGPNVYDARVFTARSSETPDANNPANPVFAYTFKGGKVPDSAVHTTALAYKRGPGGRAVIYADGRVVWKADK